SMSGCNPFAAFYFVAKMLGADERVPPPFEFKVDEGRIMVVTVAPLDMQIESGHIDHDLNSVITRKLIEGFALERKTKKFQISRADKTAKWQDEHPEWTTMKPGEIGKARNADYVIYVEIESISYFQPGSSRQLLQGKADLQVSVHRIDE